MLRRAPHMALIALLLFTLAPVSSATASPPPMMPWKSPYGMTVNAPKGWNATPYRNAAGQGVRFDKRSGELSILVYVGNITGRPDAQIRELMQAAKLRVVANKFSVSPDGRVGAYLDGEIRLGNQKGYATAVAETGRNGVLMLFFGLPLSYHLNGREKMVPAMLGPRGAQLLRASRSAPIPRLAGGSWRRLSAGAFADRVQNGHVVGTDSAGSGTSLTFKANGTYHLVYHHYSNHGVCRGHNSAQEAGRYQVKGGTLTLQPAQHQGEVCGCCRPGQKGKAFKGRGGALRHYSMRSVQGKAQGLILNGPCAKWMTESHCSSSKTWDLHYVRR